MNQYLQAVLDTPKSAHVVCPEVAYVHPRTSSTGSAFATSQFAALALSLLAISAPTGVASIYDLARSTQRCDQIPCYDSGLVNCENPDRNPRSRIRAIRTALGISVSDLSSIFGVSRQAIYKWLAGGAMSNLNYDKFEDLSLAAAILAPLSGSDSWSFRRRRDRAGQALLEALRNGKTAKSWAQDVAFLLQDEQQQRNYVDQLLSSHRKSLPALRELGVPVLDERND
jgi:transcriptional regulator with XRE-family HTH domain